MLSGTTTLPPPRDRRRRGTTGRRTAAVIALAAACWTVAFTVAVAIDDFPRGLLVLLCGAVLAAGVWEGVLRRGWGRVAGLVVATAALGGAAVLIVDDGFVRQVLLLGLGALVWHVGARLAFRPTVFLPPADPPRRPVLFINPRSGGGKAERFGLADEARARGIEPVELGPDDDLATLVNAAADDGADGLAMAGGDGSQAIVAAIAAERGLPYACVPSGTRNHFALDLGVDRDDVVGALDAFVDGGERVVDLAEVNGRVFVNNVSLGLYATAVQRDGYRGAKLRTLLNTVPDVMGPAARPPDLRWTGQYGRSHLSGTVILVSNNRYRFGPVLGSGTRPRIDDGELGIAVMESRPDRGLRRLVPRRVWHQWSAPDFEVRSVEQVPAGIDGEATILTAPLRFRVLPAALRVRIAPTHPGASPSATRPASLWRGFRTLVSIAAGRDVTPTVTTAQCPSPAEGV
jgi:diacylglycerol kinase family enzyme